MDGGTLETFWNAVPSVMKLLLGVFLGATVHFIRNRAVPVAEGLAGAATSLIAGFVITYGVCYWRGWNAGELWFAGAGLTFMANYFLGGMETVGKQIQDTPVKLLVETIMDTYDVIKARLGGTKPND